MPRTREDTAAWAVLENVPSAALPELIRYVLTRAETLGLGTDRPPRVTVTLNFDTDRDATARLAQLVNQLSPEGVPLTPLGELPNFDAARYLSDEKFRDTLGEST